ncbi:hypothetical protein [Dyella nitratireducens]|uniref:hypothetical protein n=1 Tax=Dyella nitratireducens TaxID=1849580 RepID=UPI00166AD217|nr:hypothetical protein [Dyella nitratireducens]
MIADTAMAIIVKNMRLAEWCLLELFSPMEWVAIRLAETSLGTLPSFRRRPESMASTKHGFRPSPE